MDKYPLFPGDSHFYAFLVMLAMAVIGILHGLLSGDVVLLTAAIPLIVYLTMLHINKWIKERK